MEQRQQPAEVAPSSPLALAAIPILVVPVGRVRRSTWERYTALFGAVGSVGQSDIPLDASLATARFFPSLSSSFAASTSATGAGSSGGALVKNNNNNAIHLTWATSASEGRVAGLGLLRPASQPLALVALVDLHPTCTPSLSTAAHLLVNTLDELYPTGERPLVVRCFGVEGEGASDERELVIDSGEAGRSAESDGSDDVTVVPRMENPSSFLEALVGDLVGRLLGAFAGLANSLESASGMALLQQQSLPPLSLASSIPLGSTPHASRSTTPTPQFSLLRGETLPVSQASSPLSRTDSLQGAQQHQQLGNGHPSTPNFSTSLAAGPPPPIQRSTTSSSLRNGVVPPLEAPVGPVKTSFGAPGRKRIISTQVAQTPSSGTLPPAGSPLVVAAALPLAAARLASVLGSLYLLAGRLGDAQQSFLDALLQFSKLPATAAASAAAMAGGAGDPLWHGVTLEGLATAGILIECKPKSPSLPAKDGASGPPSPAYETITAHIDTALAMYHKATPTYAPSGESPFPALYTNAALRLARLLLVIRQRGPPSPHLLPFLRLAPGPADPPVPPSSSNVSRHAVAERATLAHGPWLILLPPTVRLAALRVLVGLFRALEMRRKEGVFARMVVACLGEMIVLGRIAVAAAAVPNAGPSDGAVGVRIEDGKEGNEALLELMDRYLVAYGVDVDASGGVFAGCNEREVKEIRAGQRIDRGGDSRLAGEVSLPIGWPELQLRALRDSIGLAELLPDHHSVVSYALTMLRTLHGFIVPGEQAHLASVFGRALATARRRGELVEGERLRFWAGLVVMSLELPSLPATSVPIQHAFEEREAANAVLPGAARDPFLFNPRVIARLGASTVVQNESFSVFVTLQNEFAFPLEIQHIRLSTTGPNVVCEPLSLVLPPNAVQSVRLSAFASEPGTLAIKGCFVRLTDGSEAEFLLPVHDAAEERRQRKRASQRLDSERTDKLGGIQRVLGARALRESRSVTAGAPRTANGRAEDPNATFIECEVLPQQPTMRIRGTSLTHGALMLYAGEESKIRITLENVGTLPVDFVKLSFVDSTTGPIEARLAEGELSAGEAHELEADIARAPVFTWSTPPEAGAVLIPPRGRLTVYVTCLGKVGCSWGNVQVSYGLLDRSSIPSEAAATTQGTQPAHFHTRQIVFPILLSVYPTLECMALDILRIPTVRPIAAAGNADRPASSIAMDRKASVSALVHALQQQDIGSEDPSSDSARPHDEHCLVAIDVRNTYMQPFEVSFRRKATATDGSDGNGEAALLSTRLVSPGSTERIVLPLRRFLLDPAQTAKPIPALGNRQFVVSSRSAGASAGEERRLRTLFWYREALMDMIEAVWREPGSARSGILSLRAQSLTEPQLQVLRADEVVLKLSVDRLDGNDGPPRAPNVVDKDTFFDVVLEMTNRLARPLTPLVHLAPLSFVGPASAWAAVESPADGPSLADFSTAAAAAHAGQYFVLSGLASQLAPPSSSPDVADAATPSSSGSTPNPARRSKARELAVGQTITFRFRLGVLARGRVGFRVAVEDVGGHRRRRRRRWGEQGVGNHDDDDDDDDDGPPRKDRRRRRPRRRLLAEEEEEEEEDERREEDGKAGDGGGGGGGQHEERRPAAPDSSPGPSASGTDLANVNANATAPVAAAAAAAAVDDDDDEPSPTEEVWFSSVLDVDVR